ncbi:hypothetical protein AAFM46_10985 [Arthrobacter sp. TMP15]|uniref:hypothetical protein n=1 Tax=Arthrobacter sp. TMP15 TaxID=3140789 RepID=UPI0031BA80B9
MTLESLVQGSELVGFKGAPFPPAVLNAAAESIRTECEWHIAPLATSTVKLRAGTSDTVLLPTMHLVEVLEVTSSAGDAVTGWESMQDGTLERPGGFPRFINVRFSHGHAACPAELLTVIAERAVSGAAGRISQESLGSRSVSLESGYDSVSMAVLQKYKLQGAP